MSEPSEEAARNLARRESGAAAGEPPGAVAGAGAAAEATGETVRNAVLTEVLIQLAQESEIEGLLASTASRAAWVVEFQRLSLAQLVSGGGAYDLRTLVDVRGQPAVSLRGVPLDQGVAGIALGEGDLRILSGDEVRTLVAGRIADPELDGGGLASVMAVPLAASGRTLGALLFGRESGRYDRGDVHVARLLGTQLAATLDRLEQMAELRRVRDTLLREVEARRAAERELARTETRFVDLFDQAPIGYHVLDARGGVVAMNARELALLGYQEPEVVGALGYEDLVVPEHRDLWRAHVRDLAAGPGHGDLELALLAKDGRRIEVELHTTLRRDESGHHAWTGSAVVDLSTRRAAEDANAYLAAIVDASGPAIIGKTLAGVVVSWNRGAEKVYGWSAEEAVGRPIDRLYPPERLEAGELRDILRRVANGDRVEPYRTVRLHKSGRPVHVLLSVSPIRRPDGTVMGASHIAEDVTAWRRAEEEVRRSEAVKASMIASALDGVVTIDHQGHILEFNPAAEAIFGWWAEEVAGKNVADVLVPPEDREAHDAGIRHYLRTRESTVLGRRIERVGVRRDGSTFPLEVTVFPITAVEPPVFSAFVRDLTERKKAEEAIADRAAALERSNRELEKFAYVASHDLQAPLRAIQNLALWIGEDLGSDVPETVAEHLEVLRGRVARMRAFLEGLLEYSRVGRKRSPVEEVDVASLVAEVAELLAPPPGFEVVAEPPLPAFRAERLPLQQVFQNLVGNALKHHDRARGRVVVSCTPGTREHTFAVADDGPGIAPEYHERVFEMFQTLRPRDEVEGTGIGLSLVKKIVESAGGRITLESEGRGAVFRFTWPVLPGVEDAPVT